MRNKIYVNDEVSTFKFVNRFIHTICIFIGKFLVCIMPAINTIGCMCLSVRELVDNTAAGEYFVMCVLDQHIHTDRNLSTTLLTSTSKHKKNNKLKQMSVFVSIGWHFYSICPQLKHKFVLNAIVKIIIIFVVVLLVWAKVLSIFWIMWFTR